MYVCVYKVLRRWLIYSPDRKKLMADSSEKVLGRYTRSALNKRSILRQHKSVALFWIIRVPTCRVQRS